MTKDERTPWEQVTDPSYFRQVIGNLVPLGFGWRNPDQGCIRFGRTGIGHAPNYQIELPDGTKNRFLGMSHGEATDAGDEFAPVNLSDLFSYADVEAMLKRLVGHEKG